MFLTRTSAVGESTDLRVITRAHLFISFVLREPDWSGSGYRQVAVSCARCNTLLGSGISGRGGELLAVQGLRCQELCALFMEL
jgi:hypothetical protein